MNPSGIQAETAAVMFLKKHGYQILARNYRCRYGEIDIIAVHQGTLCFVEVKSRSSLACGWPSESVGRAKQRHIVRVAQHYLQVNFKNQLPACRFDVVTLLQGSPPELIPDAFRIEY